MNPPPMKHVPTPELLSLNSEIERRRQRLEEAGHATELERRESLLPSVPDRVLSVAEVMPPALAVFERLQKKSAQFEDEMRRRIATAPPSIPCEHHPEIACPIHFELTCQRTRERRREPLPLPLHRPLPPDHSAHKSAPNDTHAAAEIFEPAYARCPRCEADRLRERRRRYWSRRGVPERVLDATFATYETATTSHKEALRLVKDWSARGGNFLILIGSPGTGKGHLSAAALKARGSGLWIEHTGLMTALRASYQTHTTQDVIAAWQDAEVLVIDDLGVSGGGRDEESLLYQILSHRHDKRRPTILTTNLPHEELRTVLGYRLLDRIREDVVQVEMLWASWRNRAEKS